MTSRELVHAHLRRLDRIGEPLNAVVADRRRSALAEADAADAALARGDVGLGPFHGVPCTIKESFALAGMPWTAGLKAREGVIAAEDAEAVRRMREAGAIPLGVTNTSELCMWMESTNRVYGRSNNPYDTRRTVGGSSGGEGAAIAAGLAPFGLGADVGGSIRMPAFFNGVWGHKPSGGTVPNTGQFPTCDAMPGARYLCTGPLARHVEDLQPLLELMAGGDGVDPGVRPDEELRVSRDDVDAVDVRGLEVLVVRSDGRTPVDRSLRRAQARAARMLAQAGAKVVEARFPELRRGVLYWAAMLGAGGQTPFSEMLDAGRGRSLRREAARWPLGRSEHTLAAIVLAAIEGPLATSEAKTQALVREGEAFRDRLDARLGDRAVMLYPPYTRPAPRHGHAYLRPVDWVYTATLNVLEVPVTQVPLGLERRGLPVGVQVVGARGRDRVTLAVAEALARAGAGWVPSPRLPT